MPTGLEEVHAVTDRALKQLDTEARRLNRSLNDTRADIVKAKAEYEQVAASVEEAKTKLEELRRSKVALMKDIDDHRDEQIAIIERAGKKLDEQFTKVDAAANISEAKEQKAQEALSQFLETSGAFLQKIKVLQDAFDKAIADIVA